MNKNQTVEYLRGNGFKIRISHLRLMKTSDGIVMVPKRKYDGFGSITLSKGGETHLDVTTPDRKDYNIVVKTYYKDSYNKKIGVRIGLGRILKQIEIDKTGAGREHIIEHD